MAAPTWVTDPLGTALTMLGKGGFTLAKLNRRANHDDTHVRKQTALGATGLSPMGVSITIADRTNFPANLPFVGRLTYDPSLDEEYGDIIGSAIAQGQRVVPTGGGDGVFCYVAKYAGRFASAAEPNWALLTTEVATTPEPYLLAAQWAADTVYSLYDEVTEKRVDWAAGAVKAVGDRVYPTSKNGYVYECVKIGIAGVGDYKTHAATEPTWPTTIDATVDDDDVRWKCVLPHIYVCVARAGDFKSHATTQPVWPTKTFKEIVDDQITWSVRAQVTSLEEPLLDTNSKWAADTVTAIGDEVIPAYADWAADTVTLVGAKVYPTTPNGYAYECIARTGDFKTHATTEPTWPAGLAGLQVTDDAVTWRSFIPMTAVATARAGDFKTHATTEPTWPTTPGATVVDDQVTWTMRRLIWMPARVGDERVKVTAQSNGGGTTATLTIERNYLPARGESNLHLRSFPPVTPFAVTGRYYTASAADTFLHFTAPEQVALGKALNLYFGLHKGWGKRIAQLIALSSVDKELTFTTEE